ncbi:hypothetical protein [Faecalicatena contorta]|uniref:Uncharacterized protein n=1 Tax=Faecalicatena contorta TaxID=39482 RepID=A0A315ZYE8_9FIRM|nr:hypothetical protein [Faecalicatena contorta]PWJ49910.1 hypothetical protein A8805_1054 [Faecalicatena contorta]SUQ14031.1 hypothetical protein SAMN05216529_1054 [Faecalicatena contorta]
MENMYAIQLEVPLGIREGRMTFQIVNRRITGEMELLGNVEKFEGNILSDGTIQIEGFLTSSVRRIPYEGFGKIQDGKIQMQLDNNRESYKLTGYLCNLSQKGRETNEANL